MPILAEGKSICKIEGRQATPALASRPVFLGDTSGDQQAARACGVRFVQPRYGFGQVTDADASVDSFDELVSLVGPDASAARPSE